MNFIAELKRRNVIRMAGLYLVGAWLITQVAATLLPVFEAPGWVMKTIVGILAMGFIPAMIFAWVFELTPDGLKRDSEIPEAQSIAPQTARKMERSILVLFAIALAFFGFDKFYLAPEREAALVAITTQTLIKQEAIKDKKESENSIAVLPFVNMSGKADEDYFSDGMTEELLNVLAKVPQLKVVARTSVFQFKGKSGDVREIGNKLGVAHILEGSVRRDGQQVRITAQLVRVSDGFHIWSETYDRELKSVFALQDEIALRIGESLTKSLVVAGSTPVREAVDPAAYDEFLKGRSLLRQRTDLPMAIRHFQKATALAPDFAAAWSSLSLTYDVLYFWEPMSRQEAIAALAQAAVAAEQAGTLDPNSAASEHALANVARAKFRYTEAERHYVRALKLDPSYPDAREDYSELLYQVGRMEDSVRMCKELVVLDPYFPVGWMRLHAAAMALDARVEVEQAQKRLQAIAPKNFVGRLGALDYALAYGRADEARAALANLQVKYPEDGKLVQLLLPWALGETEVSAPMINAAFKKLPSGEPSVYLIARQDVVGYNAYIDSVGPIGQMYYFGDVYRSKPMGQAMLRDPRSKTKLLEFGFVTYWRENAWPQGCRPLGRSDFECGLDFTKAVK